MTPQQVAQGLPERDLVMLMMYARKHMLPTRRLQVQLARLCQICAKDPARTLGSFLFDPPGAAAGSSGAEDDAQLGGEVIGDMAGIGVRYIGRKRKLREVH